MTNLLIRMATSDVGREGKIVQVTARLFYM